MASAPSEICPPAVRFVNTIEGTTRMIVIGTDSHMKTHTCGAVHALAAAAVDELTVPARQAGFGRLLRWARALDPDRVWAIEDCRHVSGAFERFLIARGERVVRVPPKYMAGARRSSRERGKSDSIDAVSIAGAALKEGIESLPAAHLDGAALHIRLLVDHREISSPLAAKTNSGCGGICTTCGPSLRSRRVCLTATNGSGRSPGASHALSQPPGCRSPANWCARSPRRPNGSTSSRPSSPRWSKPRPPNYWPNEDAARSPPRN